MEFPGGSGRPPPLPPGTPLPLARQGSFYSLTFDELQSAFGGAGKDFGSMNMDELLRNIWTAEESHAMADAAAASEPVDPQQPIQRQGSYTLPRTISQKTVDEVWRDVIGFGTSAASGVPAAAPAKRQPTLGEVTLEEFLVRAGVVREDIAPTTQPAPQPPPPQPQPQQALFPQGNLFAPMVPPLSLGNGMVGGVVGQGGGGGITVASPRPISSNGLGVAVVSPRPIVSNGLGKMDGGDSSSLLPVPYMFNGGLRGRKGSAVEKVAERRQRRMIKNRESAARSRARKQAYMMELEEEVAKLKELNDELHRKQVEMLEKQKNEVLERINQLGPKAKRFCLRRTLTGPW